MTQDEKYMKQAIKQAKKAYALDEVPIGCVIVAGDKIIARGYNRRNTDKNPSASLRTITTDVTSTVNSLQAASRHMKAST